MKREDARTLHPAGQEEKRKTAVSLSERGCTRQEMVEELGVHPLSVGRWLKKYREGGWEALLAKRRGRRLGSGRQLDPGDEEYLQQQLRDHTPDELGLHYALWTREAVQQLIREETSNSRRTSQVGMPRSRRCIDKLRGKKRSSEQVSDSK